MNPTPPKHQGGSIAFFMSRASRDALVLEAQLADESNRNGWAAPGRDERPAPARPAPAPVLAPAPAPAAVAPPFAPTAGPVPIDGRRDRIYTHEAAHAVAARALGLTVAQVLIYQDWLMPGASGRVDLPACSSPDHLSRLAVVLACGPCCDELLGYGTGTGSDDRRQLAAVAAEHDRRTGRPLPAEPFGAARRLLARPQVAAAVNRVAAALRFNVPMYQAQLDRLIAGA